MHIARTVDEFRRWHASWPGTLAFVPTMGALHDGHLEHVRQAKAIADRVALSIFVNPTQFGPSEDFNRYPRPFEDDARKCEQVGVDCIFAPGVDDMYPPQLLDVHVDVPALTTILEGAHRPGHFAGVCRVVAKLLMITMPDVVTFGRKDYQQLRVVDAMIRDLMIPVRIHEVPTLREPDGLAMSSRNAYLSADERPRAVALSKALAAAEHLIVEEGESDPQAVESAMAEILKANGLETSYAVVRHPATLRPLDILEPSLTHGVVALIAARLGSVRLIDNARIGG